jgi:hypothetical protein
MSAGRGSVIVREERRAETARLAFLSEPIGISAAADGSSISPDHVRGIFVRRRPFFGMNKIEISWILRYRPFISPSMATLLSDADSIGIHPIRTKQNIAFNCVSASHHRRQILLR